MDDITNEVDRVFKSVYGSKVGQVWFEPCRVTKTQMDRFLDSCISKYMESVIEPGERSLSRSQLEEGILEF